MMTILVVDDDEAVSRFVKDLLSPLGHHVRSAATGTQALASIAKEPPDILILDLSMPSMNGVDVLRQLKTQYRDPLPFGVLIVTGNADEQIFDDAVALGIHDILLKPIQPVQLLAAIRVHEKLLRQRQTAALASAPHNNGHQPGSLSRAARPITVLLAEDDDQVAKLVDVSLRARGYQVLLAKDGDAALQLFQARGGDIDVLLTDVMLPRITGLDLVTLVQGQWPGTKIIVCSGQLSIAELVTTGMTVLPKPFTVDQLLATVSDLAPRPSGS